MATLMIVCPACGKCKAVLPVGKPQPVTDQLAIEPAGRVRAATRESHRLTATTQRLASCC